MSRSTQQPNVNHRQRYLKDAVINDLVPVLAACAVQQCSCEDPPERTHVQTALRAKAEHWLDQNHGLCDDPGPMSHEDHPEREDNGMSSNTSKLVAQFADLSLEDKRAFLYAAFRDLVDKGHSRLPIADPATRQVIGYFLPLQDKVLLEYKAHPEWAERIDRVRRSASPLLTVEEADRQLRILLGDKSHSGDG